MKFVNLMKFVDHKRGTLLYAPQKRIPLLEEEDRYTLRYIEVGEFVFYLKRVHPSSRYIQVMTSKGETGCVVDTDLSPVR